MSEPYSIESNSFRNSKSAGSCGSGSVVPYSIRVADLHRQTRSRDCEAPSEPFNVQQRFDERRNARGARNPIDNALSAHRSLTKSEASGINKAKLSRYGTAIGLFFGFGAVYFYNKFRHFMRGDGNPGVVVFLNPTLVAVATDLSHGDEEYLAVKIIRTKLKNSQGKQLQIGSIIATAAQYGAAAFGNKAHFASFDPVPVEEATANESYIESLIQSFDDQQYERLKIVKDLPQPYQPGLYYMWADGDLPAGRRAARGTRFVWLTKNSLACSVLSLFDDSLGKQKQPDNDAGLSNVSD